MMRVRGSIALDERLAYYGYRTAITQDRIAIVVLDGWLLRGETPLSDSTGVVELEEVLRRLEGDRTIKGVFVLVYSSGGSIHAMNRGVEAFVRLARRKPIAAHIEDIGAASAYTMAAQCRRVTCNRSAEVGDLGVMMVVSDYSKMAESEGVVVHRIRAGEPYKGAGVPGVRITDEQVAKWQEYVDTHAAMMIGAIAAGRGMSHDAARQLLTGESWIGEQARKVGLVDAVNNDQQAIAHLRQSIGLSNTPGSSPSGRPGMPTIGTTAVSGTTAGASLAELKARWPGKHRADFRARVMNAGLSMAAAVKLDAGERGRMPRTARFDYERHDEWAQEAAHKAKVSA